MNRLVFNILIFAVLVGCNNSNELVFESASSKKTHISFENSLTETNELSILDYLYFYNGGGVALGDINNDGLTDIYFSGNQVKNKLYLNKGNLEFEDITDKAGVAGNSSWNTGTVMADINGDGFLDIYVCAVVGINGFSGANELFINNGDNTFTESAATYKLDFDTYSSSAAFLDFDLDGDLDMYLLNHAIHTQESFGKADLRFKRDFDTGDKLLRNDNGFFTDVSEQAGIFGGPNSYGLGLAISDFNQDGYPDIFVGNDFHEDDYYYINNGNGTFTESAKAFFGHTSRFSMGNDVADINHDGFPDIISLDMLPEEESVLKASEGDDDIQVQELRIKQFGYNYQFTRNMLYINQKGSPYLETALLSGVAATDWSWSALFGDYNQDGETDLFISNGIPKRPNNLDFIKFVSNSAIKSKISNTKLLDKEALNLMPSGVANNYIFKGNGNLNFENKSAQWLEDEKQVSGATAASDLDNDGDLDLVVNNTNALAAIYENTTNTKANYLKLKFKYNKPNTQGIGTKVIAYSKGKKQFKELYTVRGFQAASDAQIHFGFANIQKIDSIKIIWPNQTFQTLKNVNVNQTLVVSPQHVKPFSYQSFYKQPKQLFKKVDDNLGIHFTHQEDNYLDFNRQKLIPYRVSDRGPALAIGDINNDGKDDIFFGGSRLKPSKVFLNNDLNFTETRMPAFANDSIKEDVTAAIFDVNKDGKNDLFIGSGGADYFPKMEPLRDSYYQQTNDGFTKQNLPAYFENASVVKPFDFDKDGDLDIFVGNHTVSNDFGKIPNSYILKNNKGVFEILENSQLKQSGMITDAIWDDFDNDGKTDLIVVGEWMAPKFFKNSNNKFVETKLVLEPLNGLWQSIIPFDIDHDGEMDYLLGNWGANTKFKASAKYPMKMYYSDFDANGSTETIVCTEKQGAYYTLLGFDPLASQMVSLKKKFVNYKDFAGKPVEAVFDKEVLNKAKILEVHQLKSGYLKNNGTHFTFVPFKNELQVAPITCFLKYDFNKDGKNEVLLAGNYFGVTPFHGRFDSFPGALIKSENDIQLTNQLGLELSNKQTKHLSIITLNNQTYILATFNNDQAQVYQLLN